MSLNLTCCGSSLMRYCANFCSWSLCSLDRDSDTGARKHTADACQDAQHKVNPELAEKLSQNKKFLFYINVEPLSFMQNLSEKRLIEPLILWAWPYYFCSTPPLPPLKLAELFKYVNIVSCLQIWSSPWSPGSPFFVTVNVSNYVSNINQCTIMFSATLKSLQTL